jgi:hypothetical protein
MVVNVADFKRAGDIDDTEALQRALNAAAGLGESAVPARPLPDPCPAADNADR